MQMQLRGLLQLVKCQNVFSEPQTYRYHLHICNLAFVNRSVNMRLLNTRDTWLHTWLPAHGLQAHGVGVGGLDHVQDGGLAGLGLRDRSLVTHWIKQRSARDM